MLPYRPILSTSNTPNEDSKKDFKILTRSLSPSLTLSLKGEKIHLFSACTINSFLPQSRESEKEIPFTATQRERERRPSLQHRQ
jgi:hypothetical protein